MANKKINIRIQLKIVARGGSNGGLLMGAIATQRPDLYRAIICQVPLLDMIRYHKFQIARFWIPEYGDPEKQEDFGNLLSYSPYHSMKHGVPLPEMLVTVGENDSRVDPLHGKKFVALAQQKPEQKSPIMLYVDYDSGHGSGKSMAQMIEDQAFLLALYYESPSNEIIKGIYENITFLLIKLYLYM